MARYAERKDLPQSIIRALNDPYYNEEIAEHWQLLPADKQEQYKLHNYSATTLPRSPRERILNARHGHKAVLDPLSGFWKLFGHTIHEILRQFGDEGDMIEKRMGMEIEGVYIHGAVDVYKPPLAKLEDYKITSAYTMRYPDRASYVAQQNTLAAIFRENGHPVEEISLIYLFRNHQPNMYQGEDGWYPKEPVLESPIEVWPHEQALQYIYDRMQLHNAANDQDDADLAHCTDEERWMSAPIYKIYKFGDDGKLMKRAAYSCASALEAEDMMPELVSKAKISHEEKDAKRIAKLKNPNKATKKNFTPPKFEIKKIEAAPIKCSYCEISDWCSQNKAWRAANVDLAQSTDEAEKG